MLEKFKIDEFNYKKRFNKDLMKSVLIVLLLNLIIIAICNKLLTEHIFALFIILINILGLSLAIMSALQNKRIIEEIEFEEKKIRLAIRIKHERQVYEYLLSEIRFEITVSYSRTPTYNLVVKRGREIIFIQREYGGWNRETFYEIVKVYTDLKNRTSSTNATKAMQ